MELVCNFPLFTILLCLLSSVLCTLLGPKAARRWTLGLELALLALCAAVLSHTLRAGEAFTYVMGEFPAPWGNEIRAGALEALLAVAFLVVLVCSVLGGWDFTRLDVEESKQNLFFSLVNLFTAALMALVWTNDVFTGYVFLEIMTLSSCGLIAARELGRTTLAAVRYMIMNLLGSGLFLLGVVLLYELTGHLLMAPMRRAVAEIAAGGGRVPLTFALTILTVGLGIKSGLFPFYFWMPDTYGASTPTGAAILSALVSKSYIFLLFKIFYRAVGDAVYQLLPLRWVLFLLGLLGMVAGSFSAIRANNINRMVAYSSAAQIGYIYMGLGIGGTAGYTAALFQILVHAVTKSLLFITTPRLASVSGDSLLFKNLQGSGKRARSAGLAFTAAALSMVGVPFFAGFAVKLFFAVAAVESGDTAVLLLVMLALGVSSILNAVYFVRTVVRIYSDGRGGADISSTALYDAEHHVAPAAAANPLPRTEALYRLAAAVLILCNLFLGLSAPTAVDVIRRGLAMFG